MPVLRESPAVPGNMYCSISGAIPADPVVSVRSGHLYDRRLIEKVLSANGNKCPETGEPLMKEDLLSVKTAGTVAPMPPEKSSVPDVIQYVRDEWDRLTIEAHQMKNQLYRTQQELATALYRYDAAVKVIANLEKERDEALRRLHEARIDEDRNAKPTEQEKEPKTSKQPASEEASASASDSGDASQLSPGLVALAKKKGEELQAERIARKPTGAPGADVVAGFNEKGRVAVDGKDAAVTCLALGADKVYAGCSSGKLHCIEDLKVSRNISAHKESITSVWAGNWDDRILSGGKDGCVRLWDAEFKERGLFEAKTPVVDVERHPIGLVFCCHQDGFIWRDEETGAVVGNGKPDDEVSCGAIHPDGMVFAIGGNGIGMWDLASMSQVARLGDKRVIDVAMSEKGYYMVSCDGEVVEVWDLRKRKVVGTMDMGGAAGVGLDQFGEYGCVAGREGVGLFVAKKRANRIAVVEREADSWSGRRGIVWDDNSVLVGSGDGIVRLYSG